MKSLFQGLIGIKFLIVVTLAIFSLVGICAFLVDHLVQLQESQEIQKGTVTVETALYNNFLNLQTEILANSSGLSNYGEFLKIAKKITADNSAVVRLELRSRGGVLINSYQSSSRELDFHRVRTSLSPWLIHQFAESVDTSKVLYSAPYSTDLLLTSQQADPSNRFFISEFIPLISINAVLVVVLDCRNLLLDKSIQKTINELKSQTFQIQTINNLTISSSHHFLQSKIISKKIILPIDLPGLSLQIVGERYEDHSRLVNPLNFVVVSFCLIIAFLVAVFLRSFQLQKNAERELKDYHDILLDQSRLATVGEISSVLSHEINQPIATIETYASAIQHLLESKEEINRQVLLDAIEKLKLQTNRVVNIVSSIRSLFSSRSTQGVVLSVKGVLEKLDSIISMQAERFRAKFIIKIEGDCFVLVNRLLLEQVILNLARNAFQSMSITQSKAPLVIIEVFEKDGWCEITFVDNGSGVSHEASENLFKPFFSTKSDGMGLGLSLSRSLVERFGGRLSWKNLPHVGAKFMIKLPLHTLKE